MHLPFQHRQVVRTVRARLIFCFYMGKAPLGTQSCGPKLCFHQYTLAIEFLVLKKTVGKKKITLL